MRHIIHLALAFVVPVLFASCYKLDMEFTINPDQSGKVRIQIVSSAANDNKIGSSNSQITAKSQMEEVLKDSKGVEVWKDVSFETIYVNNQKFFVFQGTAYFKNLSELKLKEVRQELPSPKIEKAPEGRMRLILQARRKAKDTQHLKADNKKKTETGVYLQSSKKLEPIAKELQEDLLNAKLALYEALLTGWREDVKVHLPGRVLKVSNLKKVDDRTVQFKLEGKQMIDAIRKLAKDEPSRSKIIGSNFQSDPLDSIKDDEFNEKLFGHKGPLEATFGGKLRPLFDYKKEVEEAKKAYPSMLKSLRKANSDTSEPEPEKPSEKASPVKEGTSSKPEPTFPATKLGE